MSDITLSSGVRSNLVSLQQTADLMETTQERLSTGKEVNSALDNPTNYFTSESLNSRASDLDGLLDSIGNSTEVLEAADSGIEAISDLIESAESTVNQALEDNEDATGTDILSNSCIDTTGTTGGSTTQERVENQTLSNLGISDSTSDFTITSTSENGVTSTFDLQEYLSSNDLSLSDYDGEGNEMDVEDLVDCINDSGIATADITSDGRLELSATGNASLELEITGNTSGDSAVASSQADSDSVASMFGFGESEDDDGEGDTVVAAGGTDVTWTASSNTGTDTISITNQASTADADNEELVDQFNEILDQINELARDASYNGINLIDSDDEDLTVSFNENRDETKSELTIESTDLTADGLSIYDVSTLSTDECNSMLDTLDAANETLESAASSFGSNLTTVTIREDFTENMINTLETGADNLVAADTNEEGANLLALETRQSLATTSLSMASSADQAVLSFL